MITVGAIHSGATSLAPVLEKSLAKEFSDFRIINIIDDTLIHTVIRDGCVTEKTVKRVVDLAEALILAGADVVVDTCSSIGEAAEIADRMLEKPVVRIDSGMVEWAVENYQKIGVLASLSTTLDPTVKLVQATRNKMGKDIVVSSKVAEGAFEKWIAGDTQAHDALLIEGARALGDVDVILLAQVSMMRVQEEMENALDKPVLASPDHCARQLRKMFPQD